MFGADLGAAFGGMLFAILHQSYGSPVTHERRRIYQN